jgi:NADH-quinone oxidoreductase subunit M
MTVDWTIYLTFIGAGVVALLPRESRSMARWVALAFGVAGLALALYHYAVYNGEHAELIARTGSGLKEIVNVPWIPTLGVTYRLAVDGISLPLVALNGFVCVTGILFSWNIENRTKEFFAFFLVLIAAVYGVFMAMDLFLFFVFYELAIIPKYFIISIWGSTRKEYGAMKLVLYSFVGSALVFVGILVAFFAARAVNPEITFDMIALSNHVFSPELQRWVFPLLFVGFAVLAGMWPFHTWAPTGHVAAPTAASMLLAGVVMKLGSYGCLRASMLLMPDGLDYWKWWIAVMAVTGIVYGAAVAMVQKDFKFIIGYSSVSHMGFVLLGLATLNVTGMSGAVLQMFSHGVVASLLFAVVGRMVYDRTHTRQLDELGGLRKPLPFAFWTFLIGGAASMGMPGFSGFVAEIQVLIGAFSMNPWFALGAGAGIVITVAYILTAMHKVFFAEDEKEHEANLSQAVHESHGFEAPANGNGHDRLPAITLPEKAGSLILMTLLVVVGLYPSVMLNMIRANVELLLDKVAR